MGKTLGREEILAAQDLPSETVEVPEWGGSVILRGLTASERDAFEASQLSDLRPGRTPTLRYHDIRASLVVRCIVDEGGKRVFADTDVEVFGAKSAVVVDRLFDACSRLSGLSPADVEELAEGFDRARGVSVSTG